MLKTTIIVVIAILAIALSYWVFQLIILYGNVNKFSMVWQQRVNDSGQITYLALGDSAAQGLGASQAEDGYVGVLARRITAKTGKSVRVVNISKSGAKLKDVIDTQLPEVEKYKAAIVTLDIGGNDIKTFDAQKYEVEISQIINKLPKGTYVSDVPYFTTRFWNNDKVDEANKIFYRMVKSRNDLKVVPLHTYTKERISRWRDFAADWFHPNNRGYAVWADAFWSKIKD